MINNKPILCLDFDGVLHSYTSGWQGVDVVPDPPVKGAMAFLWEATEHFRVVIFSTRSQQVGGRPAMQAWLRKHFREYWGMHATQAADKYSDIEWPAEKPPAVVTLDDRAVTFTGVFPPVEELLNFEPWNKREGIDHSLALEEYRKKTHEIINEISDICNTSFLMSEWDNEQCNKYFHETLQKIYAVAAYPETVDRKELDPPARKTVGSGDTSQEDVSPEIAVEILQTLNTDLVAALREIGTSHSLDDAKAIARAALGEAQSGPAAKKTAGIGDSETKVFYEERFEKYGVVRVQEWPEGLEVWVGGKIIFRSWSWEEK